MDVVLLIIYPNAHTLNDNFFPEDNKNLKDHGVDSQLTVLSFCIGIL